MKDQFSKLWAISLVLILTFTGLIYWGIKSYSQSSIAIERLTQPDSKTELLNQIFKYVYQSDLHFSNYILTNDSLQQKQYQLFTQKTDSSITLLATSLERANPVLAVQVDTLTSIIAEKNNLNNTLINLKKKQNSQFFVSEALNRIKNQLSDSTYIENLFTEQQELIVRQDTVDILEVLEIPDDFKGISGFFRRLFGIENIKLDTVLSKDVQTRYNLAVTEKKSLVRDYSKDSTLFVVKTILLDVLNDEIAFQKKVFDAELEMIIYNELLLQNIRKLLEDISAINRRSLQQEQELAKANIQYAHQSAFVVAGIGILIGLTLLLFLFKDISQSGKYRKRLEIEKEHAEELAKVKETFLSSMSHEIRTPLHSISGLSQLLVQELPKTSKAFTLINGVLFANQYLRELIENILEQAKINTGKFQIEYNPIRIPELVTELKQLFSFREMEHQNEFRIIYSDDFNSKEIIFDGVKLKQILINLIGNAFKFTKNGRITVEFSLISSDLTNHLHIDVSDTGIGIDPRYHESIFESFSQIESSKTGSTLNGTGLGLSITKHILSQAGGNISVRSESGKGSTFIVDLPVEVAYTSTVANSLNTDTSYPQSLPIHVLAIEDDEWNAILLKEYLQHYVEKLIVITDSKQAISYLIDHHKDIHIVLTDLNLPDVSGLQLFDSVKPFCTIPFVALSASMSKNQRQDLLEHGFVDALGKPFTEQELRSVLHRLFPDSISKATQMESKKAAKIPNIEQLIPIYEQKCFLFIQAIHDANISELARLAHQLKSNTEQIGYNHISEELESIQILHTLGNTKRILEISSDVAPKLLEIVEQLKLNPDSFS